MTINTNVIICFDFETAGKKEVAINPYLALPIQVAAVAYDPRKLMEIPGATFMSMMKPDVPEEAWLTAEKDWAGALDINKKTIKQIREAPSEGEVWKNFASFVNRYNPKGNLFGAPIAAGQNIDRYDCIIADRLNIKHKIPEKDGKPLLFYPLITLDLKNFLFSWFEGNNELKNYSMNTVRPYFGISDENSHDALVDAQQTGEMIMRFLKMQRKLAEDIQFKGSFQKKS
jgi:DNA polymerase III epsilon subunit-like protein